MQSVEREQLKGRETHANIYREFAGCRALEKGTRLPGPRGAYSPPQETDIKQLRVQ